MADYICEKTPAELYLESFAKQNQLYEERDIITVAMRQIGNTSRVFSALINDFLKGMPRAYIEKISQIERIKNNALLGNANKRRLIRMINRAYRERAMNEYSTRCC